MNWTQKVTSWVPQHFKTDNYIPYLEMIGSVLQDMQDNLEDTLQETYIEQANRDSEGEYPERTTTPVNSFLDIHARERCFARVTYGDLPESDAVYQNRVRRIKYNRTKEHIIRNIESVLGVTEISILDDLDSDFLTGTNNKLASTIGAATANKVTVNGEEFGNYGPLDLFRRHNCFSILIETPVRPPFSFFNQKAFYNERFFMDTRRRVVDVALINVLQTLIQQKIPAGAGYRLLVKGFDGINALSIAQQESELNKQLNRNC